MSRALVPGLKALSYTQIEKRRELPLPGEILVESGQRISGEDVIAQAQLPGELFILRLPERMGIEIFEVLSGLKVKEGESVEKGQLLCEHAGLFGLLKTRFEAPEAGTIEFVSQKNAHVGLRFPSNTISVQAHISGTIVDIDSQKSCLIRSLGCYVQGIFGVGGERRGNLLVVTDDCDREIDTGDVPKDVQGKILVGGSRFTIQALHAATRGGAVGIITGSIDDAVLAEYLGYNLGIALTGDEEVPMTLIITEGFGKLPFSERVFRLLSVCDGSLASINGATQVRAGAVRPEIFIERDASESDASAEDTSRYERGLEIGSDIRIIRVPYFGVRATVAELPSEEEEIDTGAKTRILRAKLVDTDSIVTVPRANVELL